MTDSGPGDASTLAGSLLVATPALGDPNFAHTVVFLLAHGEEGAFGLVLNRPSDMAADEVVPGWADLVAPPTMVFMGGPVAIDSVVGLARSRTPLIDDLDGVEADDDAIDGMVVESISTVDLDEAPGLGAGAVAGDVDAVRMFAGSAGWGPGQLEAEIGEGAWFVVEASSDDLLTDDPGDLWRRVLRRQPGELAWFANALGDPLLN